MNPSVNAIVTLLDPELALAARPTRRRPARCRACRSRSRTSRTPPGCARPTARRCSPTTSRRTTSLLVERLRAAGAVIIGKTNTPEFGAGSQTFNEVFGATRNPHDLTKTPGRLQRRRRGRGRRAG